MSRLIDADAFAEFIKYAIKTQKYDVLKVNDTTLTVGDVLESVVAELEGTSIDGFKNNPTVDVEPRMKGKWIEKEVHENPKAAGIEEWQSCKCSVCGRYDTRPYSYYFDEPHYCSWCGADMRGDSDE